MVRQIFLLVVITVVGAALLTPVVYTGLEWGLTEVPWPFSRVYDRVAMVVILACLIYWRKEFQLSELKPHFQLRSGRWWSLIALGAAVSLVLSLCTLPVLLAQDELVRSDRSLPVVVWKIFRFIPAALLISVLEESFFRMLLLRRLQERFSFWIAALLSSFLYAGAHFIQPVKSYEYSGFDPLSGLTYLGAVFERMHEPALIYPYFGLVLVGLVLCSSINRTGRLALCIGLHSGWVLVMKAIHYSADLAPGNELEGSVGRRFYLVSQPVVWISILMVGALVYWLSLRWQKKEGA